ncbi:hypothetical protein L1887_57182 [Cichorium endivia]|nr:hypothetical protein L1887_57182 [Cichorium endivia]
MRACDAEMKGARIRQEGGLRKGGQFGWPEEDVESMHEAGRRQEHRREQRISLVSAARPERHVTSRQQWRGAWASAGRRSIRRPQGPEKMSMIGQHDEAERHPSAGGERSIE